MNLPIKKKKYRNDNVFKVYQYFKNKGLNEVQIAGIIGNMQQESYRHIDPTATNGKTLGIVQWLGSRKKGLEKFAAQSKRDIHDITTQLDYIWHEFNTTERRAFSKLNTAKDPREAAIKFNKFFERSGENPGHSGFENRLKYADMAYELITKNKFNYNGEVNSSDTQTEVPNSIPFAEIISTSNPTSKDLIGDAVDKMILKQQLDNKRRVDLLDKNKYIKNINKKIKQRENLLEFIDNFDVPFIEYAPNTNNSVSIPTYEYGGSPCPNPPCDDSLLGGLQSLTKSVIDKGKTVAKSVFDDVYGYIKGDKGDKPFSDAYKEARMNGEKDFYWKGKRYSTKYNGSEEEQLIATGITDSDIKNKPFLGGLKDNYIYRAVSPSEYPTEQASKLWGDILRGETRMDKVSDLKEAFSGLNEIRGNIRADRNVMNNLYKKVDSLYAEQLKATNVGNTQLSSDLQKEIDSLENKANSINDNIYNSVGGEEDVLQDAVNKMTDNYGVVDDDFWAKYMGVAQTNSTVVPSKYKPKNSKDKDVVYYTAKDDLIKKELFNYALELEKEKPEAFGTSGIPFSMTALANVTIDKGEDDRGKYYSIYDVYDFGKGAVTNYLESKVGQPYEIYDRVYYNTYDDGVKRMYYNDKELLNLDINSKNIDVKSLQKELLNRGFDLPHSIRDDGSVDGVLGDETKKAYLELLKQLKN